MPAWSPSLPFDRLTIFSKKVFWGATSPLRPPAIPPPHFTQTSAGEICTPRSVSAAPRVRPHVLRCGGSARFSGLLSASSSPGAVRWRPCTHLIIIIIFLIIVQEGGKQSLSAQEGPRCSETIRSSVARHERHLPDRSSMIYYKVLSDPWPVLRYRDF